MSAMLRLLAWILAVALVLLPVVAVVNGWVAGAQFPLRTLRVQGALQRVDEAKLRATVLPYARRGFFAVQPDRIQAALGALPWVERAEVRKHWPDVLEVRISEHRPFARWGKDRAGGRRDCTGGGLADRRVHPAGGQDGCCAPTQGTRRDDLHLRASRRRTG